MRHLILNSCEKLTLYDPTIVSEGELRSNFFITPENIKNGLTRAKATIKNTDNLKHNTTKVAEWDKKEFKID